MQIEAGKYYRTRGGRVIGPMREIVSRIAEKWKFWAIGFNDGAPCWTDEGRWSDVEDMHEMDLISEVYVSDTPPADAPAPEVETLRDRFAIAALSALTGLMVNLKIEMPHDELADKVYRMADAMMEARKK
jgi:hypothetical protein